jgi:uncharacterized protein (DUF1800 family)
MGNLSNYPTVAQAFTRFGFGGRPDDDIPSDPVAWLTSQISCADQAPVAGMTTLQQGLAMVRTFVAARNTHEADAAAARIMASWNMEVKSFLAYAVTTPIPFRERLVWFWSNHFAIMAGCGEMVKAVAGPYVRDAIRAHMTGTITDMLQAVIFHPAMLWSLDAPESVGPDSVTGLGAVRQGIVANINENLGRETLELYTVGINEGYTQADVDGLAYLLSGLDVNVFPGGGLGTFYNTNKQQPGTFQLLGHNFAGTRTGLMNALHMLGTHPATYQHLATELVTHFVSDEPSASDVQIVADAFARSGGSLPAAHAALIGLQSAWTPLQKLRTPADLVIAALRAMNVTQHELLDQNAPLASFANWLLGLGQPTWSPPFPNGWSDLAADWTGPGPMAVRADWANAFSDYCATNPAGITRQQAQQASVAPLMSQRTMAFLENLSSAKEQFTLLFCSSEFQRR